MGEIPQFRRDRSGEGIEAHRQRDEACDVDYPRWNRSRQAIVTQVKGLQVHEAAQLQRDLSREQVLPQIKVRQLGETPQFGRNRAHQRVFSEVEPSQVCETTEFRRDDTV